MEFGNLEFETVTDFDINLSNSATQRALEDGSDVTDHITNEPITISIQVTIKENASEIREQLIEMRSNKVVEDFFDSKNMQIIENVIITDLSLPDEGYEDGFVAQIDFQQIKMAEQVDFELVGEDPETGEEVQVENDQPQERSSEEEEVDQEEVPESWSSWLYKSFDEEDEEGDEG